MPLLQGPCHAAGAMSCCRGHAAGAMLQGPCLWGHAYEVHAVPFKLNCFPWQLSQSVRSAAADDAFVRGLDVDQPIAWLHCMFDELFLLHNEDGYGSQLVILPPYMKSLVELWLTCRDIKSQQTEVHRAAFYRLTSESAAEVESTDVEMDQHIDKQHGHDSFVSRIDEASSYMSRIDEVHSIAQCLLGRLALPKKFFHEAVLRHLLRPKVFESSHPYGNGGACHTEAYVSIQGSAYVEVRLDERSCAMACDSLVSHCRNSLSSVVYTLLAKSPRFAEVNGIKDVLRTAPVTSAYTGRMMSLACDIDVLLQ